MPCLTHHNNHIVIHSSVEEYFVEETPPSHSRQILSGFFKFQTYGPSSFIIQLLIRKGAENNLIVNLYRTGCKHGKGVKAYFSPCRCFLALSSSPHLLSEEMRLKQLH